MINSIQSVLDRLSGWALNAFGDLYPTALLAVRYLIPVLSLIVILRCMISLFREEASPEEWGKLILSGNVSVPLTHWENTIGRARSSDIRVDVPTVSRSHGALIRDDRGNWTVYDLSSRTGIEIDHRRVKQSAPIRSGQVITVGGLDMVFLPIGPEGEREQARARRYRYNPVSQGFTLFLLTLLQLCFMAGFTAAAETIPDSRVLLGFLGLIAVTWIAYFFTRILRRRAFEAETIALLLTPAGFAVCGTSAAYEMMRQILFLFAGIVLYFIIGAFLRNIDLTKKLRIPAAAAGLLLLAVNLVLSERVLGAKNWLSIGGFSFQPSEFVKVFFIYAGAATLDHLFTKKNLLLFIGFAGCCVGALVLMSDFGTALVFFVTYLVIAFMRSGSFSTVFLSIGGSLFAGILAITAKPYIKSRFAGWRHAWDFPYDSGYQQTRAMSAAAGGGLFGLGPGRGWLETVVAANTDLVFGILCEEEGLLFALFMVFAVLLLGIYAFVFAGRARSSFTVIGSIAASSLLIFQMCLNVLGSMDILPFTGVTFPFVSRGGSSLIACWGLLAFIKACDTRQNASFTIRLPRRVRGTRRDREPVDFGEPAGEGGEAL